MCNQLFTPLLLALSLTLATCLEPTNTTKPIVSNTAYNEELTDPDKIAINNLNTTKDSIWNHLDQYLESLVARKISEAAESEGLLNGLKEVSQRLSFVETRLLTQEETTRNRSVLSQQKETEFKVITDSKKNWYEAFADCRRRGLDLASIVNEKEYQNIYSQIKDIVSGRFWLSATDLAKNDTFVWMSTGENVRYHKWNWTDKVIQPDNYVSNGEVEHCMELSYGNNYQMNDYICSNPSYYVCDDRNLKKPEKSERSNKTFTISTGNELSWYEALIDCKRQGLRLATVESQEEQDEVIKSIKLQDLPNGELAVFWLSGLDLGRTNNYVWMTSGQPLNYTAWNSVDLNHLTDRVINWFRSGGKEPNHLIHSGETEHCLNVNDYGYKWNDDICSRKHYYICDNQA